MTTNKSGGAPGQEDTAAKTLVTTTDDNSQGSTSTKVEVPLAPLDFVSLGWPVFPCRPGGKEPLTSNGFKDASDDEQVIRAWLGKWPTANWAAPTGVQTVDVLDVDVRPNGDGRVALARLKDAGLLGGALGVIGTPNDGLHFQFRGTNQSCGRLPKHYLDWKSCGGYVLLPGSTVNGRRYEWIERRTSPGGRRLLWDSVKTILEPSRPSQPYSGPTVGGVDHLVRWVAEQPEGNRNSGLYWAACRAIEGGHRGELQALVDAAITAGLDPREAERTVFSAERRLAGAA